MPHTGILDPDSSISARRISHSSVLDFCQATPAMCAGLARASPPTEEQLWSYLVQLTAALRAAHSARRALRAQALAPSKVLLTSPGRIRVGAHAAGCTAIHLGLWLSCILTY